MTLHKKYHDSSSTLLVLLLFKIPTALDLVCFFCPSSDYIPAETYGVKTCTNMLDTVQRVYKRKHAYCCLLNLVIYGTEPEVCRLWYESFELYNTSLNVPISIVCET